MMPKSGPRIRLDELVTREPVTKDQAIAALMPLFPAGRAARTAERRRRANRSENYQPQPSRVIDPVSTGRRYLARQVVTNAIRDGHVVEVEGVLYMKREQA